MIAYRKVGIGGGAVSQPGGKRAVRFDTAPRRHIAFGHHGYFAGLAAVLRTGALRFGASCGNLFDGAFFVVGGVHAVVWRGVRDAVFVSGGGTREQDYKSPQQQQPPQPLMHAGIVFRLPVPVNDLRAVCGERTIGPGEDAAGYASRLMAQPTGVAVFTATSRSCSTSSSASRSGWRFTRRSLCQQSSIFPA